MRSGLKAERRGEWVGAVVAALVSLAVHTASVGFWFHSDDFFVLRAVRNGGPFGIWSDDKWNFFRPLASASVWIDWRLWGLNAGGYHLTNVILAAIAAALVTVVARRLAPDAALWATGTAGVIFALMPAHAEAVEWISCRGDLLATVFGLGAIVVALRGGGKAAVGAAILVALACAAKESALTVPLFLGLIVLATGSERRRWTPVAATFGAAVVMVGLRTALLGRLVGGYGGSISLKAIVANAAPYLAKALAPLSIQEASFSPLLSPLARVAVRGLPTAVGVLSLLLIGGVFAWRAQRGGRLPLVLFAGFFVLVLPALPIGMVSYTWEGNRFVYFPSFALAILLALGLARLPRPWAFGLGTVLGFAYLWGDSLALNAWRIAGDRTRAGLTSLVPLRGSLLLLSAPDNYRGVFVLRNGIPEGLDLLGDAGHPDVLVLTSYASEAADDGPSIVPNGLRFPTPTGSPQRLPASPERLKVFGAENARVGAASVDLDSSSTVARGVVTADGFVPVP